MALAFGFVRAPGYDGIRRCVHLDGVVLVVVGCVEVELPVSFRYLDFLIIGRCGCSVLSEGLW